MTLLVFVVTKGQCGVTFCGMYAIVSELLFMRTLMEVLVMRAFLFTTAAVVGVTTALILNHPEESDGFRYYG